MGSQDFFNFFGDGINSLLRLCLDGLRFLGRSQLPIKKCNRTEVGAFISREVWNIINGRWLKMYRLRIVRTIIFTLFAFSTVVATLCAEVTADDQSSSLPSLLKAQGGGQTNPGAPPQDKTEEPRAAERVKPQVIAGVFTFRYESCDTDVGVFTCHFRVTK